MVRATMPPRVRGFASPPRGGPERGHGGGHRVLLAAGRIVVVGEGDGVVLDRRPAGAAAGCGQGPAAAPRGRTAGACSLAVTRHCTTS